MAPWDLLDRPSFWYTAALDYDLTEIEATAEKRKIEAAQGV